MRTNLLDEIQEPIGILQSMGEIIQMVNNDARDSAFIELSSTTAYYIGHLVESNAKAIKEMVDQEIDLRAQERLKQQ